jgi:hypothetical protein
MYPSATLSDFHPPCLFREVISPPESTRRVAEVRRRQYPLYSMLLKCVKKI